jgi:hypothetical protein
MVGRMSDQPLERLTRYELYDLWSKPLTTLASELRVPNVVIAKTCDKLRVPRPSHPMRLCGFAS